MQGHFDSLFCVLFVDFSRLTFCVPIQESLDWARAIVPTTDTAAKVRTTTASRFCREHLLHCYLFPKQRERPHIDGPKMHLDRLVVYSTV